jgi:hypothetical protein
MNHSSQGAGTHVDAVDPSSCSRGVGRRSCLSACESRRRCPSGPVLRPANGAIAAPRRASDRSPAVQGLWGCDGQWQTRAKRSGLSGELRPLPTVVTAPSPRPRRARLVELRQLHGGARRLHAGAADWRWFAAAGAPLTLPPRSTATTRATQAWCSTHTSRRRMTSRTSAPTLPTWTISARTAARAPSSPPVRLHHGADRLVDCGVGQGHSAAE